MIGQFFVYVYRLRRVCNKNVKSLYIVVYNSCFKLLVIISIMEWTDNKTKLLIEEFEKHRILVS